MAKHINTARLDKYETKSCLKFPQNQNGSSVVSWGLSIKPVFVQTHEIVHLLFFFIPKYYKSF